MYRLLSSLLIVCSLPCEIVDRIAITVDQQVVTELQIGEELHVTAFLNHAPVSSNLESRRTAAGRIVAQLLVAREMKLSHYPAPDAADVDRYLDQIKQTFSSKTVYEQALRDYQISEPLLKRNLENQLAILTFIDLRFRPSLDIPDSEVQSFYAREIATWKADHPGVPLPSLGTARPAIVKTLFEEQTDKILDTWLEEARKQVNIIYLDTALQ